MKPEDLTKVVKLEKSIFPDPWSQASFEYEIHNNPFSVPLILEMEGEVCGYAIIWRIYEEFHIANIAIRPDMQDKKLGSTFLEYILSLHEDCAYAILEVRESNLRAIHLYEKFGFRTIMKRERYYKNGETALVMQRIFEGKNARNRSRVKS
jgi:ribosomal-protein-alanine N-acetyltransferase